MYIQQVDLTVYMYIELVEYYIYVTISVGFCIYKRLNIYIYTVKRLVIYIYRVEYIYTTG